MWVLKTILMLDYKPEKVGLRYQLFYKVAKRSKDIHNFSAVRAIMSALQPLERIRSETRVETSELWSMTRLGYQAGEHDVQDARRKNKPFLQSLQDILLRSKFTIDNVADTHHQIHWGNYLTLHEQVKAFTSQTQLVSSQQYIFGRSRVEGFVKKCLINVELVDSLEVKVEDALRRYWGARPKPRPLFRQPSHRA